jgi:chorismate synthase
MSHNSFGHLFRVTTWGESHGTAIGCVVDGCPPNIEIDEAYIQQFLDQRKPGQSKYTTQRKESDTVQIMSGVFEGKTTGTPISLVIFNEDQRSKDYGDIAKKFRPGHADYTYIKKYGIRDHRGGGRSSARETAMRVAAGAIARKVLTKKLGQKFLIQAALTQIGTKPINRDNWDWSQTTKNPFWAPDAEIVPVWENYMSAIRKNGSSVGAIIEVVAKGAPVGLGEPVYGKLDSDLASNMMSINAVKGVEIGEGMNAASLTGEENADEMYIDDEGNERFTDNHSGGILGGISTGQDIVVRFAVKPTSSILTPRKTIDIDGNETDIITKGRHDPCVGIRAIPVGEAMMACTILDHYLRHKAQCGFCPAK